MFITYAKMCKVLLGDLSVNPDLEYNSESEDMDERLAAAEHYAKMVVTEPPPTPRTPDRAASSSDAPQTTEDVRKRVAGSFETPAAKRIKPSTHQPSAAPEKRTDSPANKPVMRPVAGAYGTMEMVQQPALLPESVDLGPL